MRTKDEMATLLSRRLVSAKMDDSTWSDLVASIQATTPQEKDWLVKQIAQAKYREVGQALHAALLKDAEERAKTAVNTMLADDTLTLAELDTLI